MPLIAAVVAERKLPRETDTGFAYRNIAPGNSDQRVSARFANDTRTATLDIEIFTLGGVHLEKVFDNSGQRLPVQDACMSHPMKDFSIIFRGTIFASYQIKSLV